MNQQEIDQTLQSLGGVVYSTRETLMSSYEVAKTIAQNNIKGAVIECGVASGGNFGSMMCGILGVEPTTKRTFYGFDSFVGIQLAGKKDTVQAGIGEITHNVNVPDAELLVSSGVTVHSKVNLESSLNLWGLNQRCKIELVEGWVQNTITQEIANAIGKIAILRLDMDVYHPTMHTLEMLYDNVSIGGAIIIDDWGLVGVQRAVMEFWDSRNIQPEIIHIDNSDPIYWFKT
jgi:O-methyltransferase